MPSKSNRAAIMRANCKSKNRRTMVRAESRSVNNNNKQMVKKLKIKFSVSRPNHSDFLGIKGFLQQLFLKAPVNLSDMSELIKQSNISTVIKQAFDKYTMNYKDYLDAFNNRVFGISSIINITQQSGYAESVHTLMLELSKRHGDNDTVEFVNKLLSDNKNQVGLFINERYLNIPPSISGPLFEIICKELPNIKTENPSYNFTHLFMICKLYKVMKVDRYVEHDDQILWRNPEEQFFDVVADYKFEYCVQSENFTDSAGEWVELNNLRMIPFRRVLIFPMNKFYLVTKRLESFFAPKVIKYHSAHRPDI